MLTNMSASPASASRLGTKLEIHDGAATSQSNAAAWPVLKQQKSQDQPGAKVEPRRRATAPDRRAHAVSFRRRRDQHRFCGKTPSIADFWTNRGRRAAHLGPAVLTPARSLPSG